MSDTRTEFAVQVTWDEGSEIQHCGTSQDAAEAKAKGQVVDENTSIKVVSRTVTATDWTEVR